MRGPLLLFGPIPSARRQRPRSLCFAENRPHAFNGPDVSTSRFPTPFPARSELESPPAPLGVVRNLPGAIAAGARHPPVVPAPAVRAGVQCAVVPIPGALGAAHRPTPRSAERSGEDRRPAGGNGRQALTARPLGNRRSRRGPPAATPRDDRRPRRPSSHPGSPPAPFGTAAP